MTDSLRTRIIEIIYDGGDMPASKAARLADSIISKLPLIQEDRLNPDGTVEKSRHVTQWAAND